MNFKILGLFFFFFMLVANVCIENHHFSSTHFDDPAIFLIVLKWIFILRRLKPCMFLCNFSFKAGWIKGKCSTFFALPRQLWLKLESWMQKNYMITKHKYLEKILHRFKDLQRVNFYFYDETKITFSMIIRTIRKFIS